MSDSPRSRRIGVTRRLPRPDRVRPRPTPPESRWYRRFDWNRVATIAGVVLGIGTLAFAGIATYYQAEVSADQLTQSKEDAAEKAKSQAERIALWVEYNSLGEPVVRVMNRSSDPVTRVVIVVGVRRADNSTKPYKVFYLPVPSLRPCSILPVELNNVRYRQAEGGKVYTFPATDGPYQVRADAVDFVDSHGRVWFRTSEQLQPRRSEPLSKFGRLIQQRAREHRDGDTVLGFRTEPTPNSAGQCESPTS
ncbi:hypothetical protein [Streptomyces lunaelactis]|uniref:hypothetical protein n=1 Tax=Streptomyces lunaelactis TaxID=1535768 RepID=UPI001584F7E4|nr:hypothetical protein [Streptomyces lunaelactis]NUK60259.1 hypothetical protein [Streptomyces lunaelactis]